MSRHRTEFAAFYEAAPARNTSGPNAIAPIRRARSILKPAHGLDAASWRARIDRFLCNLLADVNGSARWLSVLS